MRKTRRKGNVSVSFFFHSRSSFIVRQNEGEIEKWKKQQSKYGSACFVRLFLFQYFFLLTNDNALRVHCWAIDGNICISVNNTNIQMYIVYTTNMYSQIQCPAKKSHIHTIIIIIIIMSNETMNLYILLPASARVHTELSIVWIRYFCLCTFL